MSIRDDYSLLDYGWMINAEGRTRPWVEALRRAVAPGSVVLDIGTGTGFFAFLACRFGAARVYAVEPDDAIEIARLCAPDNEGSERITWIKGFSTEIELPERVDVVIADLHGNLPFHTGNLRSLIDARTRHLKPGGRIIPARDVLYAVPASAPEAYRDIESPWGGNEYGVDFRAARVFATNSDARAKGESVPAGRFLAEPGSWGVVDYASVDSPGVDGRLEFVATRSGTMHGLYVWFDGGLADGLGFSNIPTLPPLPYGRKFFPLESPVELAQGDRIQSRISATLVADEYIYRWETRVLAPSGARKADMRQSTFRSRPLKPEYLRRAAASHVPALGEEGRVDAFALSCMQDSRSLDEIAGALRERFPTRFASAAAALDHVSRLSVRYSQ